MNRPIRKVAVVAGVMFFALLANTSYAALVRDTSLNAMTDNRRARDAEFAQDRGPIMVGETAIASTTASNDQFRFQRSYANPLLYAPITGYYAYDYGRSGLEQTYNRQLAGTHDSQVIERMVDAITGKTPKGAIVQTTINPKLQQVAYSQLGKYKGAVVVLDPKSGAVLALASTPTYDPNAIASHDLAAARQAWTQLTSDPARPMADRASREVYPPGSTFKLVTAAAALEDGDTPNTMVASPASLRLPLSNVVLTNQVNCGGDQVTLTQALETSCNTAFAGIGGRLGPAKLAEQARKFGFGEKHLGDLNGVASRFPANPDAPQTMMSAIGQYEVAASPLQMAMVVAAIVNDGVVMEPYVVSEVRSSDLTVLYRHGPDQQRAMSAPNARLLQQMMVAVVNDGTGSRAKVEGVVVGGKTGTAQSDPARPPYAWFVAFAKNPDLAIAVFVEDADIERTDIAGGRLGGPIAKAIIEVARS